MMPKKKAATKKRPADPRPQRERFIDFARDHGAVEDVLEKAFEEIGKPRPKG